MTIAWMDGVIAILQLAMTLGIIVLSILLFWHLRRIGKSVLAFIFWCVMLLTALTPLMHIAQSGAPISQISLWYLCLICIVPLVIIACYFVNPLKPVTYDFDDDEDSDEPFIVPDEV
ncbi:MAG: hypothetical protein AAF870_01600 [Pseudomonadota bacterium]